MTSAPEVGPLDISYSSSTTKSITGSATNSAEKGFLTPKSPASLTAQAAFSSNRINGRELSPSYRPEKRARYSPIPMTAAAAMSDTQTSRKQGKQNPSPSNQTSANPNFAIKGVLMGGTSNAVTKVQSPVSGPPPPVANATTTVSDALALVTKNIQQPATGETLAESPAHTSPASLSSLGTLESIPATSGVGFSTVASPAPIEDSSRPETTAAENTSTSPDDGKKVFSYQTPLLQVHVNERRGMSLPGSGLRQGSDRSPIGKKHRCPYCSTEFTRHHNLKSHLLTHSQEKPYVCSTCQSRFRRLHDLKRHTKLHTGERPHICPICGRKFARGDALARHNKGPGGCAGRRESVGGGFSGDEDYDGANDDSMDGLVYGEPDAMDDEEGNEKRPGIRRHGAPEGNDSSDQGHFSRQVSTYPPIQGRPPGGIASGLFPSRPPFDASSSTQGTASQGSALPYPQPSSSSSSLHPHGQGAAVFSQNPMTESPKPLSPGAGQTRRPSQAEGSLSHNRSSSASAHLQHQQFSRGSGSSLNTPHIAPQLPPPHGLSPLDSRFTLPSQVGPTHPPTGPSGPPTHMSGPLSSHSNSHSSHAQSAPGSGDNSMGAYGATGKDEHLWTLVRSLEQRVLALTDEVGSLRSQLAGTTQSQLQEQSR